MASSFQEKLIKKYEEEGWDVIKTIRLNKTGYPDLFLFKKGTTMFIESKEANDSLSELQKLRIDQLNNNGFIAYCEQELKGIIYPIKK